MGGILGFLIKSNAYLAVSASAVAYICMVLLAVPFRWEPLAISFCATFFLYNLNRWTDMEEDRINCPERTQFVESHGKGVLYVSAGLYVLSLVMAAMNGIATLMVSIVPFALVFSYSVFRFKKLLILKNVMVALGWALISFVVVSYSPLPIGAYFSLAGLSVFAFLFARVMIDTVIFDVIDMNGDRTGNVNTIANRFGPGKAVLLSTLINVASFAFFVFVWNVAVQQAVLIANVIFAWSFAYYLAVARYDVRRIPDVVIDGELIFLGAAVYAVQLFAV